MKFGGSTGLAGLFCFEQERTQIRIEAVKDALRGCLRQRPSVFGF
jgi:hypothetical protein